MMDVGLFDDEITVPGPAVLSSVVAPAPATGVPSVYRYPWRCPNFGYGLATFFISNCYSPNEVDSVQ
jgi:hypothetical protein